MNPDERPRPQYGEYASEAERAAAIERSGGARPTPSEAPAASDTPVRPAVSKKSASTPGQPARPALNRTANKGSDRIVTIFLLTFGLVYIIGGAGSYFTLGASMERMFAQLGVGEYTPTTLTPIIGIVIVVSEGIIWLLAAGWSYRRISSGRPSWWIPVAAGIIGFFVSVALLGVLLAQDPAFLSYVSSA
ncbi:MAG: hypothetical protein KDB18_07695 [Salinibacterium sp.]|nr:hypothetical protein [Cryobacterium sp.]MCB1281391.1 hypothetical protein [Salinibacterium sp.]